MSNARLLKVYLNNIDEKKSFYTPNYLYKQVSYNKVQYQSEIEHSTVQKNIGRLYEYYSIQTFPREIRYILFKNQYRDFDIKNAHPTIALNYAEKHGILETSALLEFVEDRDNVLAKITQEFGDYLVKNPHIKPKTLVLKYFNRTWLKSETGSKTLDLLDTEFEKIRNHL